MSTPVASAAAVIRATHREWVGLAVLALPCLLATMDLTVLNLALPRLSAALRPSSAQLLWIVDIYGFMIAGSLITMGMLGDRIGRRRLLLIGAAFAFASVLAAFSTSAGMLIATRAVLGIAGATLVPSTLSLIRSMFHDAGQRMTAIGIWVTSFSVGGAIGPLVGGVVLEYFWWGAAFLIAVPVMLLLLALGPLLLPEFRDSEAGRPDLVSAVLSLLGVLAVIYGLTQIAQEGVGWPPMLSVVVGLAMGVAFVRRQQTLVNPLIDLQLFRAPAFSVSLASNTVNVFVSFGSFVFIAQYLQLVLGLSPLRAGLWSLPSSCGAIVGSMLAPLLVRRIRPAFAVAVLLAVAAIGFGLLAQVGGTAGLAIIVTSWTIWALGGAAAFTVTTGLIVGTASPERAGAASAIAQTFADLGGALGIAILGSIGAAVYRSKVAATIPAGVPREAAVAAQDTLGGAVAVAGQLPDQLGRELLAVARDAFASGLHVTAAMSAVLTVGMIVLVAFSLRRVRTDTAHDEQAKR